MAGNQSMHSKLGTTLRFLLISLIRCYQYIAGAIRTNCCRFEPSCSNYAIEAINRHGCVKGIWLTLRRLTHCHPWHAGGVDPVP